MPGTPCTSPPSSPRSPCPLLLPDGVNHVCVGTTAYINDSMGLHAVRCDDAACGGPGAEEGAVSLHIYAPVSGGVEPVRMGGWGQRHLQSCAPAHACATLPTHPRTDLPSPPPCCPAAVCASPTTPHSPTCAPISPLPSRVPPPPPPPPAQPIRRVRLYEPEADRVVTRAPGFRTIRGVEEEDQMDASLLSSTL